MDWGSINNLIQDGLWLAGGVVWLRKMHKDRKVEMPFGVGFWTAGVLITIGLIISSFSLYFSLKPRTIVRTVTMERPQTFVWKGGPPSHVINNCWRRDQEVPLDDYEYTDCTFQNVTFVYNGTGSLIFSHNHVQGWGIRSDNPGVSNAIVIVDTFAGLKVPVLSPAGKSVPNIGDNTYSNKP